MYLNPNDNKTIYPIYNKLNNLNLTEQEQNNLYSGYNISNNTYNISNNTNNLNKNKIQANIIPQTSNQIRYMDQTHYQPQVNNYINSKENGISNAINNNIKINNEVNKNGMNIVNQYNKN